VKPGNMYFVVMFLAMIINVAVAQDYNSRDTLRLEASGDWLIQTHADSAFSVAVWAWSDDDSVIGASIPLRLAISGDGYNPAVHDSFVVVDTIMKDPDWNPTAFIFRRSVIWNDVDYANTITDTTTGWVGTMLGGINFTFVSLFNNSVPTKLGDIILKIRYPDRLPTSFDIEIDSLFYPPAGTFAFSALGRLGYSPEFVTATLNVQNSLGTTEICGDANRNGDVDIDDIVFIVNYIFSGGPAPEPLHIANTNCMESVDIDDIIFLVNYVFQAGPDPCDINDDGSPDC
jgi:hypothetical protein